MSLLRRAWTTLRDAWERRLVPGDALLRQLALRMPESVVVTDAQRRIVWTNAAFEQLSGYTLAESRGCNPAELLQFEGTDPATIAAMRDALDAGCAFRREILNRDRNGRLHWLDLAIEPLHDPRGRLIGFMSLQLEISARRRMKADLRRNADVLLSAIEAIDEGFVLYDPQDRFVYCNERYRELYALSRDLLVPGTRFEEIVREGVRRGQYDAAIGREEEWIEQRLAMHRGGDRTLVQRLPGGRIVRVRERITADGYHVGFRIDITDLVRATEAAEGADRAKSEFIATISHELRTPLQTILGFSDLGRVFAQGHAQFQPMFEDIHAGGQRMLRLVNGLLDMSKIDGTLGSLALERGDLAVLVAGVANELQPLTRDKRLSIRLAEPMPALPAEVDAFRMQQVFRNLLANAIRYSPEGGTIDVDGADLGRDGVVVRVRDHGPGIPADELDAVFEPFRQSSRTRDGSGGTGLGLTISRRIVRAHGGRIEALQPDGAGACLRVTLPAAVMPMAAAAPHGAGEPPEAAPPRAIRSLRAVRAAARERDRERNREKALNSPPADADTTIECA